MSARDVCPSPHEAWAPTSPTGPAPVACPAVGTPRRGSAPPFSGSPRERPAGNPEKEPPIPPPIPIPYPYTSYPFEVRREGEGLDATGEVELELRALGIRPPVVAGVVKVANRLAAEGLQQFDHAAVVAPELAGEGPGDDRG